MRTIVSAAAGLAALVLGGSAGAAQAPALLAPPPVLCELHVWPSPQIKALSEGWVSNDVVDKAFDPAKGGVPRPQVLSPEAQAELLSKAAVDKMVGLAPARVIVHHEPLPHGAATAPRRNADSSSGCYMELIVGQIAYEKSALTRRSLRSLLTLRRFEGDSAPRSTFETWAGSTLELFPPQTPDKAEAANAELVAAYLGNIRKFGEYAARPPKPPRRR
jgi:hypothetical protein